MSRPPTLIPDTKVAYDGSAIASMRTIEAWHAEGRVEIFDRARARGPGPKAMGPELDELCRLLFPAVSMELLLRNESQLEDVRILRTAVEHRIEFLVTEDGNFHRCDEEILQRYDVHVIRPDALVALVCATEFGP
jgi:hypothetical protein